jgi:hypothetical protein
VNWSAELVALVPLVVVTVTLTVPMPGGDVPPQEFAVQEKLVAGVEPKLTLPPDKLDPLIVTAVPPVVGP